MRGRGVAFWILLILFIIGIAQSFLLNPIRILVPLLVFGAIYYFYKHPEKVYKVFYRTPSHSHSRNIKKKKSSPFTVIKGNKDDDQPKYH